MKLNYKRTVLIGFAFMSILAFWQFYDQVIPVLLESIFGIPTFYASSIMAIDNILALFMLPLFGALSDKTKSPLGKRTPYILFGTIAAFILMLVLGTFTDKANFIGFIITLMVLLITMSVYRTPAVAYMPDVTEKPLRSKGNAIINLVGYIGGIFTSVVIMFMLKSEKDADGKSVYVSGQSFFPVFAVIAAFMLVSVLIMVLTVNENKVLKETNICDEEEQNTGKGKKLEKGVAKSLFFILASVFLWYMAYNGVTTTFSRYCLNVLNVDLSTSSSYMLTATITAIIAFVPLGFLSSKIGRKKTILIGVAVMTACLFGAHFITGQTPMLFVILGVIGVAWAAINVNSFPMVVEMSSGADVGKYTGIYYTFSMAAQITTPVLSGFIIDNLGFGYKALFPYAVIFAFASFVTMCFVKHGDSKPETRKSVLESFDTED